MVTSRKIIMVIQPGAAAPPPLSSAHSKLGSAVAAREVLAGESSYRKKDKLKRDWLDYRAAIGS